MLALETLNATRIVASRATLDSVTWPASVTALRFAPDDLFLIGGDSVAVSGEHVIAARDAGYSGSWLTTEQLAHVAAHIDWPLPTERPSLAQGFVAGVPAKLHLAAAAVNVDGTEVVALLLTNSPYAAELQERLR